MQACKYVQVSMLPEPPDISLGLEDMELQSYEANASGSGVDIDMQPVGETPLEMLD